MALLLDTGPLLAAIDRSDPDHNRCKELVEGTREPLVVPAPVVVELDYWCRTKLTPDDFLAFLSDILVGAYRVEDLEHSDYARARDLQATYADNRIGFVDAAVLAVVERLGETKLATLDHRHFSAMRPAHVQSLRLVP
ncbi:MAG: type II toxin-antitoxin system VapC family toxin [Candidatus Dormibacteraceae bacterium]